VTRRKKRPTVLTLGYCTLDVIRCNGMISHQAGGTAANVAANLAFLGWQAGFAGRLGRDPAGRRIRGDLRQSGVNVDLVDYDPAVDSPVIVHEVDPPRHSFLFRCPNCERRFPRHRPISETKLSDLLDDLPAVDVFFFDRASAPALHLTTKLHERGSLVVFEPSAPGRPSRTLAAAEIAHIVKCSHERREQLPRGLLCERSGQLQIETLGARGLRYRQGSDRWRKLAAPKITVSDSGGAGDWLTASFLAQLAPAAPSRLLEDGIPEFLSQAQAIAALCCRFIGARTMAKLPPKIIRRAATDLLAGRDPTLPKLHAKRPSRAQADCFLCLR
jgi:fructokinase